MRILILLLFFSTGAMAQNFPVINGKIQFKDSLQFSKYKNNAAGDSVLTTDTSGKVKMVLSGGGSGGGTVDSVGALPVLFTTSTPTTTPIFVPTAVSQWDILGRSASGSGAYTFQRPDTGFISNFHLKVRNNLNAGTGMTYSSALGTFTNNGVRTASNGLIVSSNNVKWGGTFIENTVIENSIYNFTISNSSGNIKYQLDSVGGISAGDIAPAVNTTFVTGPSTTAKAGLKITSANSQRSNILLQSNESGGGISTPANYMYFGDGNRGLAYIGNKQYNLATAAAKGALIFGTTPDISTTAVTERMIIDTAGNVGINIAAPTQKLHVGGGDYVAAFGNNNSAAWISVGATGSSNNNAIFASYAGTAIVGHNLYYNNTTFINPAAAAQHSAFLFQSGGVELRSSGVTGGAGLGSVFFAVDNANQSRATGTFNVGANAGANSTLQTTGSFATAYTTTATNLTLTIAHSVVNISASGQTITLPTAVGNTGREYTIINSSAGSNTVATTSSQLIGNNITATTYPLLTDKSVIFVSDGANYKIKMSN